jgi:enoyl-CoA hydratase
MSTEQVLTLIHESVLTVTINRPEVRNAIDRPTAQILHDVFVDFDQDANLNVAVLTGATSV